MKFLIGFLAGLAAVAVGLGAAMYVGAVRPAQLQPAAPAEAPAAAARPVAGTAPASTAPAQPTALQPKVVKQENYGDWLYTCIEAPGGGKAVCSVSQKILRADTKQAVFLWRIDSDNKGGFVATWQTLTDIFVGRGLTIDAGTPKPLVVPFQLCTSLGCQAAAAAQPDFLDALSKAKTATATLYLLNGKSLTINVSVKGLPDALAQLRAGSP
jgi:invasion protein IalB